MKEEAQLSHTKACHEKIGVVPRDKTLSKMDESWIRAGDEDMSGYSSVVTMRAGGVISSARAETVQVIGVKGMTSNKLEAHRLKIAGASDKAPQSEVWEGTSHGMGEDRIRRV